jgi:NADPH-dependent glutamate synthase beta subunit-like oxidoreductase
LQQSDVTPRMNLVAHPGIGPVRTRRPVYNDLLSPCNHACPAGEDVQAWLALAQAGRYREAWLTLVRDNPLPAVHGRVCYHPCEASCNRTQVDSAVSIHAIERFLGDLATREGWPLPIDVRPSGKRVLIVGAGPSGLSAACHLARLGHAVEIHDAGALPGGMMHFGIPAYRLPREELMKEVRRIEAMGVRIILGHKVEDLLAERRAGGFDAVFTAIGAHVSKHVDIPARDAARVLDAVSFLRGVGTGEQPRLGRRVAVYGGGNTAMDAARTAMRLGAAETVIIYHRDRAHMPAHAFEADEALEEGVTIKWLTSITEVAGSTVTVEVMALGPDGRPRPTGRFDTLEADAVVLALGQRADSGFLRAIPGIEVQRDGTVVVGPNMMTGHSGVFAGGDMVPGERTVTVAVGHGKQAARHIDAWLRGGSYRPPPERPAASFEMLHLPIYSDADPAVQGALPAAERTTGFAEVLAGLSEADACYEAQRCLSCGNCFECDQCYAACPEQAIEKLGPGRRYRFDHDRCTGCAVCFEACPVHGIAMIPETACAAG